MNRFMFSVILVAGLLGLPSIASAAVITFDYTATGVGPSTVTGTFGYDTSVPDTDPNPNGGRYVAAGFLTGSVSGGAQDGLVFDVQNLTLSLVAGPVGGHILGVLTSPTLLSLIDFSGTVFPNDSLPTDLDLADFNFRTELVVFSPGFGQEPYTFQSITRQVAVPDPASLPLLAVALGVLGLAASIRRRRHAADGLASS